MGKENLVLDTETSLLSTFVWLPNVPIFGLDGPEYDWKLEDELENHMQIKGIKRIEFDQI